MRCLVSSPGDDVEVARGANGLLEALPANLGDCLVGPSWLASSGVAPNEKPKLTSLILRVLLSVI